MSSYESTLAALRARGLPFQPGSDAERAALDRFATFFSSFAPDKVDRLLAVTYAEDIYFNDTLKEIHGRAALAPYLRESAEAVEACTVEIQDRVGNGAGDYYLRWKMMIRFRRFARGRDTWSVGMSHLRFDADGRVALHHDFWNAAEGLYQYVPVLGAGIRAIQRRL
jgi:hypothetical protein